MTDRELVETLAQTFRAMELTSPAYRREYEKAAYAVFLMRHRLAGHTSPPTERTTREWMQGWEDTR